VDFLNSETAPVVFDSATEAAVYIR
jgi:hypothetical protein